MSRSSSRTALARASLAAWSALILLFSSDGFGAAGTSRILLPLLRLLLPDAPEETLALLHAAARKSAHVFEYAVLGALALQAFSQAGRPIAAGRRLPRPLVALLYALLVATADEARQATSDARTGTPRDVALDAAGAATGIATLTRWTKGRPVDATGGSPSAGPPA